jgi:hypothetical protein
VGRVREKSIAPKIGSESNSSVTTSIPNNKGSEGEKAQGESSRKMRFVGMFVSNAETTGSSGRKGGKGPKEGQGKKTSGIKGGAEGGKKTQSVGKTTFESKASISKFKNDILGVETGEERKASEGKRTNPSSGVGERKKAKKTPSLASILLISSSVDDGTGPKEEKGLKDGVVSKVINGNGITRKTQGNNSVPQLRTSWIRNDALEVILDEAGGSSQEGGSATEKSQEGRDMRSVLEEGGATAKKEDPSGNSGRGVDKGGNRGRTFSGIGKPSVKANLSRLTNSSNCEKKTDNIKKRQRITSERNSFSLKKRSLGKNNGIIKRGTRSIKKKKGKGKSSITNAVSDSGLDGGLVSLETTKPKIDEEIGGQANTFPSDESLDEGLRGNKNQSKEGKEGEIRSKARKVRIFRSILGGVKVDASRDGSDDQKSDAGQGVEEKGPVKSGNFGDSPRSKAEKDRRFRKEKNVVEGCAGKEESQSNGGRSQTSRTRSSEPTSTETGGEGRKERKK